MSYLSYRREVKKQLERNVEIVNNTSRYARRLPDIITGEKIDKHETLAYNWLQVNTSPRDYFFYQHGYRHLLYVDILYDSIYERYVILDQLYEELVQLNDSEYRCIMIASLLSHQALERFQPHVGYQAQLVELRLTVEAQKLISGYLPTVIDSLPSIGVRNYTTVCACYSDALLFTDPDSKFPFQWCKKSFQMKLNRRMKQMEKERLRVKENRKV